MTGTVTARSEAVVPLQVRAAGGKPALVQAVVDTGFTDFLALSHRRIAELALPFRGSLLLTLADGSAARFSTYRAVVEWHDHPRPVTVVGIQAGALLGMGLLHGSRLTMDVLDDGPVRIEPIAEPSP